MNYGFNPLMNINIESEQFWVQDSVINCLYFSCIKTYGTKLKVVVK